MSAKIMLVIGELHGVFPRLREGVEYSTATMVGKIKKSRDSAHEGRENSFLLVRFSKDCVIMGRLKFFASMKTKFKYRMH